MGIVSPLEVGMAPPQQVGKASRDGVRKAPPLEVGGGGKKPLSNDLVDGDLTKRDAAVVVVELS